MRPICEALADEVRGEFNQRLKEKRLIEIRWKIGENRVGRLLGKELLVLVWALEQQTDASVVATALRNWQGVKHSRSETGSFDALLRRTLPAQKSFIPQV